ncbi:MAG: HlyC/CorC family transporter [Acidobacteria bacterium]|nr:HlyC/CorC family transporter [Acidobacteriota bacterium]
MLIAYVVVALVQCGVMLIAAYWSALFLESLRIRPHAGARAYPFFEEEILPRMNIDERDGVRRYAMLKQSALIVLALDCALITGGAQLTIESVLEALLIAFCALALFGHIVPAILIARTKGHWALGLVGVARMLAWSVQPLLLLTGFANSVVELGGDEESEHRNGNGTDDIEVFLDVGEEEGFIGVEDRKLIQSVVEFGDKTVREVMTARPEIVGIDASSSVEDLRGLLLEEEYSRVPVFEGSIDRVIGFVRSRDVLEVDNEKRSTMRARDLVRPVTLVPETKPIRELMPELQQKNAQMAIVIDEYGQTAGLVTMEDMMEEIVGEIRDESEPDHDVQEKPDGSYIASGNLDLDRLAELVNFTPDDEIESTTVGGMVCEHLGQVPDPGARVRLDGIDIEVLSADDRRVRSVCIRKVDPPVEKEPQLGEAED